VDKVKTLKFSGISGHVLFLGHSLNNQACPGKINIELPYYWNLSIFTSNKNWNSNHIIS